MPSLKRPRSIDDATSCANDKWTCSVCTLENPESCRRCKVCESRKPVIHESSAVSGVTAATTPFNDGSSALRDIEPSQPGPTSIVKTTASSKSRSTGKKCISKDAQEKPQARKRKRPGSRCRSDQHQQSGLSNDDMYTTTNTQQVADQELAEVSVRIRVKGSVLPRALLAKIVWGKEKQGAVDVVDPDTSRPTTGDGGSLEDAATRTQQLIHAEWRVRIRVRQKLLPRALSAVLSPSTNNDETDALLEHAAPDLPPLSTPSVSESNLPFVQGTADQTETMEDGNTGRQTLDPPHSVESNCQRAAPSSALESTSSFRMALQEGGIDDSSTICSISMNDPHSGDSKASTGDNGNQRAGSIATGSPPRHAVLLQEQCEPPSCQQPVEHESSTSLVDMASAANVLLDISRKKATIIGHAEETQLNGVIHNHVDKFARKSSPMERSNCSQNSCASTNLMNEISDVPDSQGHAIGKLANVPEEGVLLGLNQTDTMDNPSCPLSQVSSTVTPSNAATGKQTDEALPSASMTDEIRVADDDNVPEWPARGSAERAALSSQMDCLTEFDSNDMQPTPEQQQLPSYFCYTQATQSQQSFDDESSTLKPLTTLNPLNLSHVHDGISLLDDEVRPMNMDEALAATRQALFQRQDSSPSPAAGSKTTQKLQIASTAGRCLDDRSGVEGTTKNRLTIHEQWHSSVNSLSSAGAAEHLRITGNQLPPPSDRSAIEEAVATIEFASPNSASNQFRLARQDSLSYVETSMAASCVETIGVTDENVANAAVIEPAHCDFSFSHPQIPQNEIVDKKLVQDTIGVNCEQESNAISSTGLGLNFAPRVQNQRTEKTCKLDFEASSEAFTTVGFGKTISVARESIAKACQVLDGDNKIKPPGPYSMTFATAGLGKRISVSSESLVKACQLLNGDDRAKLAAPFSDTLVTNGLCESVSALNESTAKVSKLSESYDSKPSPPFSVAFATAGLCKVIVVSDESVTKADQLLGGERQSPSAHFTTAFTTAASGRAITVSSESMEKADLLLDGERQVRSAPFAPAFTTAGFGKAISVSSESMEKAEQLLGGDKVRQDPSASFATTFTTAGFGKTLSVSSENIEKADELFGGGKVRRGRSAPFAHAFTTARFGKAISVSSESMEKADQLLSEDKGRQGPSSPFIAAFTTAGYGKAINVSSESLEEAGMLLGGHDGDQRVIAPAVPAFATVGLGKTINGSSERMEKAVRLLGVGHEQHIIDAPLVSALTTAHLDKTISVSSESMTKATQVLGGSDGQRRMVISAFASAELRPPIHVSELCQLKAAQRLDGDEEACPMAAPFDSSSRSAGNEEATARTEIGAVRFTDAGIPHEYVEAKVDGKTFNSFQRNSVNACQEDQFDSDVRQTETAQLVDVEESRKTNEEALPIPRVSIETGRENYTVRLPSSPRTSSCMTADLPGVIENELHANTLADCANDRTGPTLSFAAALQSGTFSTFADECERNGVDQSTIALNSRNATSLRFHASTELPISLESDMSRSVLGATADYHAALLKFGCDGKLVSDKWIENHVRWINWKLASKERRFSPWLGGSYLTFSAVVEQLRHRFEREIQHGSRPLLRRILNRDMTAGCLMILCVADIRPHDEEDKDSFLLELTDGWYSVRCWPSDLHLMSFIREGRIRIGSKLLLSNACLVGAENGVDPNDGDFDPFSAASPTLRVGSNATRLARWNARLGQVLDREFNMVGCRDGVLRLPNVSDILAGGGNVPSIDLRVIEKHPLRYLLKHADEAEGPSVIVSEADEVQRRLDYEKQRQLIIENFYEDIQRECEKEVDENAPKAWHEFVSHDLPDEYYNSLSGEGRREIEQWKDRRSLLVQKLVQGETVAKLEEHDLVFVPSVPFLRVVVQSTFTAGNNNLPAEEALLTIWNPCDDQLNVINDDACITVMNVSVKEERYEGRIQLSASGRTSIISIPEPILKPPKQRCCRTMTSIFGAHLLSKSCAEGGDAAVGAVDIIGIQIGPSANCNGTASLYLTDRSGLLVRVQWDTMRRKAEHDILAAFETCDDGSYSCCLHFQGVSILPFDSTVSCAVVEFRNESTVAQAATSAYMRALDVWATSNEGRSRLNMLAICMVAGILRHGCRESINRTAVGYISGYQLPPDKQDLVLYVDCGGASLHCWKLCLSCLAYSAPLLDKNESIALDPDTEANLASLRQLEGLLRARHKPHLFHIQRLKDPLGTSPCQYKVVRIDNLRTEALATAYAQVPGIYSGETESGSSSS